jgi:hypothetical protein
MKTEDLPPELVEQLQFIIDNSDRFDRPQSFPFFPDDWLGSPGILTAHPAVEGGYIHLLAIEWGEVDLWLPADDESLATSSRLNSEWPKYADRVRRFFYKHPFREGLVNHKLIEIRAKQLSYATRGQAGGLAKSLANGLAEGKLDAKLKATPLPHPLPHPESPSPSKTKETPQPSADGRALADLLISKVRLNHPKVPTSKLTGADLERCLLNWAVEFDAYGKTDKKTRPEYESIIEWSAAHDFWRRQVRSPGALRIRKGGKDAPVWVQFYADESKDPKADSLRQRAERCLRDNPGCGGGSEATCGYCARTVAGSKR